MKLQQHHKSALVFLAIIFGIGYYFYSRPYEMTTANLVITASFPDTPKKITIPSLMPDGYSNGTTEYVVYKHQISYIVSITDISFDYRQKLGDGGVLNKFFNTLSLGDEKATGVARIAFMGNYNGQTVDLKSKSKLLQGKYFLTPSGIVAIYVRLKGQYITPEAVQFIDSLDITEKNLL